MFLDSLDIANRACFQCGVDNIGSITEDSWRNTVLSDAYDKLRRPELRRNVWRFAVRKAAIRAIDTTTMLLQPSLWSNSTTYLPGAIVTDSNGQMWFSVQPENLNNQPGQSAAWDMFFGPMTVSLYSSATTYYSGELVYKAGADPGSYRVFISLQDGNSDTPDVATAWDTTVTYSSDQVVSYSGSNWRSLIPYNVGNTPADGPNDWSSGITYSAGATATGSDHFIYTSVSNGNLGNDPTTDGGVHWTNTHVPKAWSRGIAINTVSVKWREISATIANVLFLYPLGSGPSSDSTTRNVFRVPAGYLRPAPQAPKQGTVSLLGAPSNIIADDWEYQGDYIVSNDVGPLIFRFVADVTKVTAMDDMFCEGLACRMAIAAAPRLTQSSAKLSEIEQLYEKFMREARMVNAIEETPVAPPLDDFLACRA